VTRRHVAVICRGAGSEGSVAAVARRQAEELSHRFDVTLISDPPAPRLRNQVTAATVSPSSFSWLRRFGHVPRELAFARAARHALRRLHRHRAIDVVLCHSHVVAARAAAPFTAAAGAPCVMVTHGDIFDRPPGTYDRRLTALYRRSTATAYRAAGRVVALSPVMADLAARGGAAPDHVCVIPNGVDAEDFGLDALAAWTAPAAEGELRLLYAGRLAVEKGADRLIEALALLPRDRDGLRLELVGDGPLAAELRARAERLGVASRVTWSRAVERRELAPKYLASHLVCVPSRSDALPTVALEAARAGRAVLASQVGGLRFIVRDGVTGAIVPADSAEAWARAIAELAADRSRLARMGEAARERAMAEFDWGRIGERLGAVIDTLAEQAGERLEAPPRSWSPV